MSYPSALRPWRRAVRLVWFLCIVTAIASGASLSVSAQTLPGTWVQVEDLPEAMGRYDDLRFIDDENGWTVNSRGNLFGTTDGGDTWTQLYDAIADTGERIYFRSVAFADRQRGWIGSLTSSEVALLETTDGGKTVTSIVDRISGPAPEGICGLWVVDEMTVFGVGAYFGAPRIIHTTDGGATWTSRDMSDLASALIDVVFLDADRGFITGQATEADGEGAAILATEDGGETWEVRFTSPLSGEQGWKIDFPTPEIGYVSGQNFDNEPKVFKTTDAGLTWTALNIPFRGVFLSGVSFVDAQNGWVGGDPSFVTTDGGATWARYDYSFGTGRTDIGPVNRIRIYSEDLGFAGGQAFYRYVPGVVGVEGEEPLAETRLMQNFPNPFDEVTIIPFTLSEAAEVRLEVYDLLGRRVVVLEDGLRQTGPHRVTWDGRDEDGRDVASGVYVYRLIVGDQRMSREAVIIR